MLSLPVTVAFLVVASQWTYINSAATTTSSEAPVETEATVELEQGTVAATAAANSTVDPGQYCPSNWANLNGQCYKVPVDGNGAFRFTWLDARDHCVKLKSDLAQPNDIKALAVYLNKNFPNRDRFWLGGSSTIQHGQWRWNSGKKITGGWRPGQPDALSGDNCLYMQRQSGAKSLGDKNCLTTEMAFVCELRLVLGSFL